jgi:hypothetical protein
MRMMNNLLDPDPDFRELSIGQLRSMMSRHGESVLRRGRAMVEMGRRASSDPALLQEVSGMVRAPENRQLITVGTTSVAQLGAAGLIAGGSEKAIDLAAELFQEWDRDQQSDFAWLLKSSGIAWPRG